MPTNTIATVAPRRRAFGTWRSGASLEVPHIATATAAATAGGGILASSELIRAIVGLNEMELSGERSEGTCAASIDTRLLGVEPFEGGRGAVA